MAEQFIDLGGNRPQETEPTPTYTSVVDGSIRLGMLSDVAGQTLDLARSTNNGGIIDAFGRNVRGRIVILTEDGNAFHLESGLLVNARRAIKERRLRAWAVGKFGVLEVSQPWTVGTISPSGTTEEVTTPAVKSISVETPSFDTPYGLSAVGPGDEIDGRVFDPTFQKIDDLFARSGLDLEVAIQQASDHFLDSD